MKSSFFQKVSMNMQHLTNAEVELVEYIKNNLENSKDLGIKEMARVTNKSVATISRLSKKLGYSNFQDLRTDLNICFLEQDNSYFKEIHKESDTHNIVDQIAHNNLKLLEETIELIDFNDFEKCVDLLSHSRYCGVFGIGGSSVICSNIYHRFLRTSVAILYSSDYHLQLMNATKLNESDCAIMVSYSGLNKDSMRTMKILKKNNVKIILITSNRFSPMAELSDIVLAANSKSGSISTETFSSMVAHITISDCLFALYSIKIDNENDIMKKIRATINQTRNITGSGLERF